MKTRSQTLIDVLLVLIALTLVAAAVVAFNAPQTQDCDCNSKPRCHSLLRQLLSQSWLITTSGMTPPPGIGLRLTLPRWVNTPAMTSR